MSKPKYKYAPHGAWWYVWEVTYNGTSSSASKISEPMEKEEARKETYRLNGWEYKAPTQPTTKIKQLNGLQGSPLRRLI